MRTRTLVLLALAVALMMGLAAPAMAAAPPAPFFNGFEDAGDVGDGNLWSSGTIVASGTGGIASAGGAYHLEAAAGSYTRYGGYSPTFPADGFTTSIDIYLDTALSLPGQDKRFEWTSAISNTAGGHLRDFVFNMGTNGTGGFVMSASNNADGWPANPGRDPFTIAATGWYTLQHDFYDDGTGVLAVDMSVLDAGGTTLHTWTLSNPADVIGVAVGGNRYGWLYKNQLAQPLRVDNVVRTGSTLEGRKQAVRDDLAVLLPSGDDEDDKRIEKALGHLDKSLDPELWLDEGTLTAKDGKKVFDEEAKVVKELAKVENTDVSAAITELVAIDGELALGAIDAAQAAYDAADCDTTMTKACEKAAKELAKAAEEMADAAAALADGDAEKAIDEYKKAWERAGKALAELA